MDVEVGVQYDAGLPAVLDDYQALIAEMSDRAARCVEEQKETVLAGNASCVLLPVRPEGTAFLLVLWRRSSAARAVVLERGWRERSCPAVRLQEKRYVGRACHGIHSIAPSEQERVAGLVQRC